MSPRRARNRPVSRAEIDLVFQYALADGFYFAEIALLHTGDNAANLGARLRKSLQNVPAMRSNGDVARKIGFVLSICAFILKSQCDPSFAIRALMA